MRVLQVRTHLQRVRRISPTAHRAESDLSRSLSELRTSFAHSMTMPGSSAQHGNAGLDNVMNFGTLGQVILEQHLANLSLRRFEEYPRLAS